MPSDVYTLGLDSQSYVQGTSQALGATLQLQAAMSGLTQGSAVAQRSLNSFASMAGMVGLARFTSAAAQAEQQMAAMRGTASLAGQSFMGFARASDQLARQFPIGTAGARALVGQIQALGVTAGSQGRNIAELGSTFVKLSAVTGESAAGLATSVINLARSFGDQNVSPQHIASLSNSLAVLSAKFGGSASGIASFAQSLSPFARQLGISQQATLGIASSFARLGDDSQSAATAVNKVMADITQAVRDGGPQLARYSALLGMTVQQFLSFEKASPTQAFQGIMRALGQPGVQSQRQLESLGFADSIRTQTALLRLTQSGTLDQAIATSMNANPNALNSASGTAMQGFNDSLGKLQGSADQLAEKLGKPTLGPLTQFSNLLGDLVSGISQVVGSGPFQTLLEGGLAFGGALSLGRAGAKGAIGYGIAQRLFNSRAIGGFRAGRMASQQGLEGEGGQVFEDLLTNTQMQLGNATGRAERRLRRRVAMLENLGVGMRDDEAAFAQTGQTMFGVGRGLGGAAGTPLPGGRVERAIRGGAGWASVYAAQSLDFITGMARGKGIGDTEATGVWDKTKASWKEITNGSASLSEGLKNIGLSVKETNARLVEEGVGGAAGRFGRAGARYGGAALSLGRTAGMDLMHGVGNVGMGLMGMMGPVGWAGLGLTAAGFGYEWWRGRQQQQQAALANRMDNLSSESITSGLDSYDQALGRAAESTKSLADVMSAAGAKILASTQPDMNAADIASAKAVDQSDISAAAGSRFKRTQYFIGGGQGAGASGLAAQMRATLAQNPGMARDASFITMMSQNALNSGFSPGDVRTALSQVNFGSPGALSASDVATTVGDVGKRAMAKGGIGKGGKEVIDNLMASIAAAVNRAPNQMAGQQLAQQMLNAAMGSLQDSSGMVTSQSTASYLRSAAARVGITAGLNVAKINQLGPQLSAGFGGGVNVAPGRAFVTGALQGPISPPGPGLIYQQLMGSASGSAQQQLSGAPGAFNAAEIQVLSQLDLRNGSALAQQLRSGTILTNSVASMAAAAGGLFQALTGGRRGMSSATAAAALTSVGARAQDNTTQQVLGLAQGLAQSQAIASAPNMGTQNFVNIQSALSGALTPNALNPNQQQTQAQQAAGFLQTYIQGLQARIQAQLQYQKASDRAWRDFGISTQRAQEDFDIQRMRTVRNFNIQLARAAQDGARSMYDPYQRIAVEPLWDAGGLQVNMRDQINAMRGQVANLKKARQMGFSNATIAMLDLANPAHAQQLQELVSSASGADVKGLNTETQQRTALAGQLYQDPANLAFTRAQQDMNTQLADSASDMSRSVRRSRADMAKQMGDAAIDYKQSTMSIITTTAQLYQGMMAILKGKRLDANKFLNDDLATTQSLMQKMGITTGAMLGQVLQATMSIAAVGTQVGQPMTFVWDPKSGQLQLQAGSTKATTTVTNTTTTTPHPTPGPTPSPAPTPYPHRFAAGYLATSMTHATIGEAGPEAIVPLNAGGLHIIRAIERFISPDEMRNTRTSGHRTFVHVEHTEHNDYSVNIEKVEAHGDAAQLMKDMREISRRKNLTKTATRR